MSDFIPVDRLFETELVMAFRHPKPTHEVHVVIVPKVPVKTLMYLDRSHQDLLSDVFIAVQTVVQRLRPRESGIQLGSKRRTSSGRRSGPFSSARGAGT